MSWDRCKTTSLTCHPARNRCGKLHVKNGEGERFIKRCFPEDQCVKEGNYFCKKAEVEECEITCCNKDVCNAGSGFRISGILLMTCVLASVMTPFKADFETVRHE